MREWWCDKSIFEATEHIQQRVWCSDFHRENTVRIVPYSDYEALAKDHADDWKRIQDAERALDVERARAAKLVGALEFIIKNTKQLGPCAQLFKISTTGPTTTIGAIVHESLDVAREALAGYELFNCVEDKP